MEEYLERLKEEINEVKAKHERLDLYLHEIHHTGTTLDDNQVENLKDQYYHMSKYIETLRIRFMYDTELADKD